jgi:hypothetical protein
VGSNVDVLFPLLSPLTPSASSSAGKIGKAAEVWAGWAVVGVGSLAMALSYDEPVLVYPIGVVKRVIGLLVFVIGQRVFVIGWTACASGWRVCANGGWKVLLGPKMYSLRWILSASSCIVKEGMGTTYYSW